QVIIGLVLIATVGLLTALPPAYQVNLSQMRPAIQAQTFNQRLSNGVDVALSVYPFHVGANSFSVIATNPDGTSVQNIVQVILDFTFKGGSLPPSKTNATAAQGQYVAEGGFLSRAGDWSIQVTVRPSQSADIISNFDLNLQAYPGIDNAKVVEIAYPGSNNPSSSMNGYGTLVDGTGNVWFSAPFPGVLGRYTPASKGFQFFQPPDTSSSPGPIVFDMNGRIWYGDSAGGKIAYFDPASQSFSTPQAIPSSSPIIGGLAVDSKNTVWVTGYSVGDPSRSHLYSFNSTLGTWSDKGTTPTNSTDLGPVAVDNQDRIWFSASSPASPNAAAGGHGEIVGNGKIEMFNGTRIREFVPPLTSNATAITGIAVAQNGDVWFAEHVTNRISRLSPSQNYTFNQYSVAINPSASPWGLTIDSQGNVWFSEHIGNRVGFYDVAKNQFKDWQVQTSQWDGKFPALDQYGNVWLAEGQGGNLAVLALQPGPIGLTSQGPDVLYPLVVGMTMIFVGIITLRWQRLVRYFTKRRSPDLSSGIRQKQQPKSVESKSG
ncbi:MAG TPA: hypothetical protein VE177_07165, partial [Candidatus Binatus sp.]|nr:hypothetical protein [Candidatus Binatus sp.]